jgi:hypothetical protein
MLQQSVANLKSHSPQNQSASVKWKRVLHKSVPADKSISPDNLQFSFSAMQLFQTRSDISNIITAKYISYQLEYTRRDLLLT